VARPEPGDIELHHVISELGSELAAQTISRLSMLDPPADLTLYLIPIWSHE
jgi:hypothetical protein